METSNKISTNLEKENSTAQTPTQKMSIETEPTQEQVINSEENSDENKIDTINRYICSKLNFRKN